MEIGKAYIFASAYDREAPAELVTIVRPLTADESDDEAYKVRGENGFTFNAFATELTD